MEEITKNYDDESELDCRLCVEISDFENSLFAHTYPSLLNHNSFLETPHLRVMIPIGPLQAGHIIIATKKHAWSFGHVRQAVISELSLLIDVLSRFLEDRYGRIIAFEHGPMSATRRGGCCLEHAHMNLMPVPESFNLYDAASKFLSLIPTELHQLAQFVDRDEPYLFFRCQREGSFAALAPEGTNQFFRKLISCELPGTSWDWRSDPRVEVVAAMLPVLEQLNKV